MKTITIDGKIYDLVEKITTKEFDEKFDNGDDIVKYLDTKKYPYVIVRTYSAGVFAGYLKERNGKEGTVLKARRIWYWSGAASLSQLAQEGTKKPSECKFPCEVDQIELTEIIEVLNVTDAAMKSISEVPVWSA